MKEAILMKLLSGGIGESLKPFENTPLSKITDFPTKSLAGKWTTPVVGLGSILQIMSLNDTQDSNIGLGIGGGALQGLAAGAALGPIGMLGGALLGGAFGATNSINNKIAQLRKGKLDLSAKTVQPSIGDFGIGGFVINGEDFVSVQMEKDEVYVTPELNIYDTKAKTTHDKMGDDDVTDIVKPMSFVFSNQKKVNMKKLQPITLGRGFAYYNEKGEYELEDVMFNDLFDKKEMSFSDAAKTIKKKIKVRDEDNPNADIFTRITNDENKQLRMPYIAKLIELHRGEIEPVQESIGIQKFGQGDAVKDAFTKYIEELDKRQKVAGDNLESDLNDVDSTFNKLKANNILSALGRVGALSMMNTDIQPFIASNVFADNMFEEVSPALEDTEISNNFQRVNSLIGSLAQVNPGLAYKLAPRLMDSALTGANKVATTNANFNIGQRAKKYAFLNNLENTNRKARLEAEQATEKLLNEKRMGYANTLTDFLSSDSAIAGNELGVKNDLRSKYDAQQMDLLTKRLGATLGMSQFDMQMARIDERIKMMKDALNDRQKQKQIDAWVAGVKRGVPAEKLSMPSASFNTIGPFGEIIKRPVDIKKLADKGFDFDKNVKFLEDKFGKDYWKDDYPFGAVMTKFFDDFSDSLRTLGNGVDLIKDYNDVLSQSKFKKEWEEFITPYLGHRKK